MIHDSWVYSVKFSPDGKYVVSGSTDKTARVWETIPQSKVSLIGVDYTRHDRPMVTRHDRAVFTRYRGPVVTTMA